MNRLAIFWKTKDGWGFHGVFDNKFRCQEELKHCKQNCDPELIQYFRFREMCPKDFNHEMVENRWKLLEGNPPNSAEYFIDGMRQTIMAVKGNQLVSLWKRKGKKY